jgi:4-carboxymuconolactone decarboxylase
MRAVSDNGPARRGHGRVPSLRQLDFADRRLFLLASGERGKPAPAIANIQFQNGSRHAKTGRKREAAMPGSRYGEGMKVRREVLGDAHVDRAEAAKTPFDAPFQELITESAWGSVWARPGWTKRERSIVTIALLAALGHHDEVAMHVRATRNTGATPDDIAEALLHVAIYAGVPAANHAIKIARQILTEDGRL